MTTKTEQERKAFLTSMGLDPDAPALTRRGAALAPSRRGDVRWAPEGVDPHTMAVSDIVFDPAMVEQFPDLSPQGRNAASRYLFDQYKSYGRNKDRNSLLHRRIGEFLAHAHRARETGGDGFVKDKIRLANTLAEHGVTAEDLEEYLKFKAAQEEQA